MCELVALVVTACGAVRGSNQSNVECKCAVEWTGAERRRAMQLSVRLQRPRRGTHSGCSSTSHKQTFWHSRRAPWKQPGNPSAAYGSSPVAQACSAEAAWLSKPYEQNSPAIQAPGNPCVLCGNAGSPCLSRGRKRALWKHQACPVEVLAIHACPVDLPWHRPPFGDPLAV